MGSLGQERRQRVFEGRAVDILWQMSFLRPVLPESVTWSVTEFDAGQLMPFGRASPTRTISIDGRQLCRSISRRMSLKRIPKPGTETSAALIGTAFSAILLVLTAMNAGPFLIAKSSFPLNRPAGNRRGVFVCSAHRNLLVGAVHLNRLGW